MYSRNAPPHLQNPAVPLAPPNSAANNFTAPQQGANIMPGAAAQNLSQAVGNYIPMQQNQNPTQFQHSNYPPHRNQHPPQNQPQFSRSTPDPHPQNLDPSDTDHQQWHADSSESGSVNAQIYRIDGNKKLVEFLSNLVPANLNDFANMHGRGGSKFASKSTINMVMSDYSGKNTNTGTVSVRYSLEWQDIELLLDRAIKAENGALYPPFGQQRKPGDPWSSYGPFEKNHGHYGSNANGTVQVFRLEIHYTPFKNTGELSSYPWFISISNFDAPKEKKGSGAIIHKSSQATNVRQVFINVSTLEFRRAMVTVSHYIRNWEIAMSVRNIQKGADLMEQQRKSRRAKQ